KRSKRHGRPVVRLPIPLGSCARAPNLPSNLRTVCKTATSDPGPRDFCHVVCLAFLQKPLINRALRRSWLEAERTAGLLQIIRQGVVARRPVLPPSEHSSLSRRFEGLGAGVEEWT